MLMETIRKDMFEAKKVKDTVKSNLYLHYFLKCLTSPKAGKNLLQMMS